MQQPRPWQAKNSALVQVGEQAIALNHLWLLTAGLFCAAAVWMCWSVITVLMLQLGFAYSIDELFSLIAIAGLMGGTLRITLGLAGGGASLLLLSLLLLLIPSLGIGLALQQRHTPLWVLQLLAILTGLGGGCYSTFVAAVTEEFPRSLQGMLLGLGTGVGHLGIVAVLIILPAVTSFSLVPAWSGEAMMLETSGSTWLGEITRGEMLWLQHSGYILAIGLLLVLPCIGWGMHQYRRRLISPPVINMDVVPVRTQEDSVEDSGQALKRMGQALVVGLITGLLSLWLLLPEAANGSGLELSRELVLALTVVTALMLLRYFPESSLGMKEAAALFNNKHTWVMSSLCAMSLGSFLGFSAALPLTFQLVFGYSHQPGQIHLANPNAPGLFTYLWMAPLIGILMRPVGGWMAAQFGGARITQACALVMVVTSACAGYYLMLAYRAPEPEQYFLGSLLLFFVLFAAAGVSHASVLHSASQVLPQTQSMHISIWISAIAGYGVFYIPHLLGEQLQRGTPEQAMIGFAVFYVICLLLNGWFYLRRESPLYNP